MKLNVFKEAVNETINKLIRGINTHPQLNSAEKLDYTQLFSKLQATIRNIQEFDHIMTFYRELFVNLENMGKYADERSKARIAQGAQAKIETLLGGSFEYVEQRLNLVNDELLMGNEISACFKNLCGKLKLFFRNQISDQDQLIAVYQLTLWLVKNNPGIAVMMIQNKRTIIAAARSGDDNDATDARNQLNRQIGQAQDTSRQLLNEKVPVNYIKGIFFSNNNNMIQGASQFRLTGAEVKQIDLIAPLLLS